MDGDVAGIKVIAIGKGVGRVVAACCHISPGPIFIDVAHRHQDIIISHAIISQ